MSTTKPQLNDFLLRRLHSLLGVLPLAGFIVFHFFANSYSTKGDKAFNQVVDTLRSTPYIHLISWGLLVGPFLLHIIIGIWIVFSGRNNLTRQAHPRNFAYFAQRITAIIIMVFVVYHYVSMKYIYLPKTPDDYYAILRAKFANPAIYGFYALGIAATAFHLANGLCTFCMTWGITVSARSQKLMAIAMTGVGILIFALGMNALSGFVRSPKSETTAVAAAPTEKPATP
ncbi:MAG: hypothetical protein K1X53_00020 [Candidatus Sumerlaeaceae bacterium]|nr:hypothetical protein [Candidatus Sumerlaeaceae bacterium]